MKYLTLLLAGWLCVGAAQAEEKSTITRRENSWTLRNETLEAKVSFTEGKLSLDSFFNRAANIEYIAAGKKHSALFSHIVNGQKLAANDGGWKLAGAEISDINLYGISWGKRLDLNLTRTSPMAFFTRQIFEIYNGPAAMRYGSFVKNGTDKEMKIESSDVLALDLPDKPHRLYFVEGIFKWNNTAGGLKNGGRQGIVRYDSGDGWFTLPENNWATSLETGSYKALKQEKLLGLNIWNGKPGLRVTTNPKAVQLVLFPREEVEYFSANLGVFKGDDVDGRMAVAEHLRKRFKYHDPAHTLSVNDWQWGAVQGKRTDANFRNVAIPKAAAAGFDMVNIDGGWYVQDGTAPINNWTDMKSLCDLIVAQGMKPGHWFPLQGEREAGNWGWGAGRDVADPANVDFKLKQTEDDLLGKYHSRWGQLDCGLLWKTDKETSYSHPSDSVYRKLLGMRRYINAVTHKCPDYLMHVTCEIDNPRWDGDLLSQNVGLAHLGDNAVIGSFRRTETADDVRDLFASVGLFPIEGELSTWGGDGIGPDAWQDSPVWYYQFLLARHTMIYSWPADWSPESIKHLRAFNDWRKNPRMKAVLNELLRPVYFGADTYKNEGPWAWMFTEENKSKAMLFAVNHLDLAVNNAFSAKLRWLDSKKTYLVEDITMQSNGKFAYKFRGEFSGRQLLEVGLPIDLDAGPEPCAAFWIQEKSSQKPQVLYTDATITSYGETYDGSSLIVQVSGTPGATAELVVFKPGKNGVEYRSVKLNAVGNAAAKFDAAAITEMAQPLMPAAPTPPSTAAFADRDTITSGKWRGKYGAIAARLAGQPVTVQNGCTFRIRNGADWVWGKDDETSRVLELPPSATGSKIAACWTAANEFDILVKTPKTLGPYKLTVYLMDYDNVKYPPRAMELSVKTFEGKVLDTQQATKEETGGGIFLSWNVAGAVIVHARKTEGSNAAVSGVFIDPMPVK